MHITRHIIQELTLQFGEPAVEHWDGELSREEMAQVVSHRDRQRAHDVSLCIQRGADIAVIRKRGYPEGAYRLPSGGVHPEESFLDGATREAWEETGLKIEIEGYPLRVHVKFFCGDDVASWATHVMLARPLSGQLEPIDTEEIESARWTDWDTLHREINPILEAAPALGLSYRARLQARLYALHQDGLLDRRRSIR